MHTSSESLIPRDVYYSIYDQTAQGNAQALVPLRTVCKRWKENVDSFMSQCWRFLLKNPPLYPINISNLSQLHITLPAEESQQSSFLLFKKLADVFRKCGSPLQTNIIPYRISSFESLQQDILLNNQALETIWSKILVNTLTSIPFNLTNVPSAHASYKEIQEFLRNEENKTILENIEILDLSQLCLKTFPIELGCLTGLKRLYLNKNKLTRIPNLSSFPKLDKLTLDCNQLTELSDFSQTPNLQSLSAMHNKIHTVPNFSHVPKLKWIYLNDNAITSIPDFNLIPLLEKLHLDDNKLSTLPNFLHLKKLSQLSFKNNPIKEDPTFSYLPKDCKIGRGNIDKRKLVFD